MADLLLAMLIWALGVVALPVHAQASEPDPLRSPQCEAARAALDQLSGTDARAEPGTSRLAAARQRVATACLGRSGTERERSGVAQPPVQVPAPAIEAPPAKASLPAVPPPPPALAIPRPTPITTCDPGGCWDSEGRRLINTGPLLMGPRGACTIQNGQAICP